MRIFFKGPNCKNDLSSSFTSPLPRRLLLLLSPSRCSGRSRAAPPALCSNRRLPLFLHWESKGWTMNQRRTAFKTLTASFASSRDPVDHGGGSATPAILSFSRAPVKMGGCAAKGPARRRRRGQPVTRIERGSSSWAGAGRVGQGPVRDNWERRW